MKRTCTSLMLAGSLLAGGQAMAGDLLQWQNNSLTLSLIHISEPTRPY